jgi:DNA repair exonuclease SbcCD ATPase subunit
MLNYKLSDNAKFNALWSLLNTNYNEAGNWLIEYDICEIYDEYAVVKNYSEGTWERVYYAKDDATDSLEITSKARCYFVDITETEKNALEALHEMNNNTYENIDVNYQSAKDEIAQVNTTLDNKIAEFETLQQDYNLKVEEITEFNSKIEELNGSISTLITDRDNAAQQIESLQATINSLTAENETLNSFKIDIEKQQKQAIVSKYAELLDEEVLNSYTTKMDEFTIQQLDKELAYELVSANQSVFTSNGQPSGFIPKDEPAVGGLEEILSKYSKK